MPKFCRLRPARRNRLRKYESSRNVPLVVTALSAPPRRPAKGHPAFRQQATKPGRHRGVFTRYDVPAPEPLAVETCSNGRSAMREEWVLCKSILSPQREPIGESIIRRDKSPMLPEFRFSFLEFLPAGRKISKIFPPGFALRFFVYFRAAPPLRDDTFPARTARGSVDNSTARNSSRVLSEAIGPLTHNLAALVREVQELFGPGTGEVNHFFQVALILLAASR